MCLETANPGYGLLGNLSTTTVGFQQPAGDETISANGREAVDSESTHVSPVPPECRGGECGLQQRVDRRDRRSFHRRPVLSQAPCRLWELKVSWWKLFCGNGRMSTRQIRVSDGSQQMIGINVLIAEIEELYRPGLERWIDK
jgi:hypothetical protein